MRQSKPEFSLEELFTELEKTAVKEERGFFTTTDLVDGYAAKKAHHNTKWVVARLNVLKKLGMLEEGTVMREVLGGSIRPIFAYRLRRNLKGA